MKKTVLDMKDNSQNDNETNLLASSEEHNEQNSETTDKESYSCEFQESKQITGKFQIIDINEEVILKKRDKLE